MKSDHIVPLSTQALEILGKLEYVNGQGKYVLPSIRSEDRCMSENTVNAALRSMGYAKTVMTAHGFRVMARPMLDEILNERVTYLSTNWRMRSSIRTVGRTTAQRICGHDARRCSAGQTT
ncbi:MAG: hypothetical protein V4857_19550 [Pseudomonadota bacterium]